MMETLLIAMDVVRCVRYKQISSAYLLTRNLQANPFANTLRTSP